MFADEVPELVLVDVLPSDDDGPLVDNPMHLSRCGANLKALTCLPQIVHSHVFFGSFGGMFPQISK